VTRLVAALLVVCVAGCGGSSSSGGGPASASTTAAATVTPVASPTTPAARAGGTRFPIVLVHGIFGYRRLGTREYFSGVEGHLERLGHEVYVAAVPPLAAVETRAAALRDQVLREFPDPAVRVNLVAHSMGGLDARAAIVRHGLASRVASLSMLSTPNRGSRVADVAVGLIPGNLQQAADQLLNVVGLDWDGVLDLTGPRCDAFNLITPDDPGVSYQSWGATAEPFGRVRMNPLLWPGWALAFPLAGDNDGVVHPDSARWGDFHGVLPADHVGLLGHGPSGFDHLRFYEELARDLIARGF
jgi:triacylglycerol lipase